jgi:hypothetical protein
MNNTREERRNTHMVTQRKAIRSAIMECVIITDRERERCLCVCGCGYQDESHELSVLRTGETACASEEHLTRRPMANWRQNDFLALAE